jgi:biopolymer transport protein ExbD/biopolymer transport protein TolR
MKGEESMSWIATNSWGRPCRRVWSVTFVVFVTMLLAAPRCTAQALKKGISVELAVTHNAIAMPDADKEESLIVAVTRNGTVYLGIDRITPAALAIKPSLAQAKLYIKADAHTSYANVVKVLDAVRTAGITAPNLLTGQDETPELGKLLTPKGLEVLLGPPMPSGAESTVVQILSSGHSSPLLKINNEDVSWANLESRLSQFLQNRSEKVVLLKADGLLPFVQVVHAVDLCRAAGATVFLVTPAA